MAPTYDVLVLGLGAMGSATAAALARRGARVLGLEQHALAHGLGSSGGQTRLVRKAYFEHPDYVPLLHRAYELWDELGDRDGAPLLHRTGLVCAGPAAGELIAGTRRAALRHGLALEELSGDEARRRFPELRLPEDYEVLLEPEGGFVLCERAVVALAEDARRHGARLSTGRRATGWSVDALGPEVRLEGETLRAARLVVTAGPWAGALLPGIGPLAGGGLRVTRQSMAWMTPRDAAPFALGSFPCWAVEDGTPGGGGLHYGFPILPAGLAEGPRGLKAAHHLPGPVTDPESVDRTFGPADEADVRAGLAAFVPAGNGALLEGRVCLYTMSPDGHFIVDHHPEHPAVVLACGFSGHGFKFAPVIGEALADLVLEGRTELPVEFLRLARLTCGS